MTTEEEEFEFRARLEREQAASGGKPEKREATTLDRAQAGVSGVDKGIAKLLGLPVDAVENIINLGIATYGSLKMAAGGAPGPEPLKGSKGGSEHIEKLMNEGGVRTDNPAPDDMAARMLHKGGEIAGSSMIPGSGPATAAKGATKAIEVAPLVKEAIVADTKAAIASAAGGAAAGEALGDEWTGVGALSPAMIRQGAASVKNKIAETVKPNVETFERAGAGTPSVGQATQSPFVQGLENLASTFPGGVGVMRRFAERQQKGMADTARTGGSAENAGRAVQTGIERFVDDFKARSGALYDRLDQHIPKDASVDVSNTRAALKELNADIPNAPALSKWFKSEKMQGIESAMGKDAPAREAQPIISKILGPKGEPLVTGETPATVEGLPYEAVKKLRTLVGKELAEPSLVSDVPRSKWEALYGALSKDMEAMAAAQGPEAAAAFARANTHYKAGVQRIQEVLDPLKAKVDAEDVFKAFAPNNPDQVNKVRRVMRSLNPSERKVVSDAVVNRLGRASSGKQDEVGSVFSSETFLTNYDKISPGARAQLFPEGMRQDMDAIAKTASNIREGSKVFANPAGTAGKGAGYAVGGGLVASVATGTVTPAAIALGGMLTTNIGARMLTSPKVVHWLAEASKAKPANMPAHLARLATIYNETKDDALKDELGTYIESVTPKGKK